MDAECTRSILSSRIVRFVLAGAISYLCAVAQMYLYTDVLALAYVAGYAITQVVILGLMFLLARYWIFDVAHQHLLRQGAKYIAAVASFRFVDWCCFVALTHAVTLPYYATIFLSMAIVFPFKYLTYRLGVFHAARD